MGTCLDILLVKTSLGVVPSNLNDMVVLMTIAARRVTKQGNQIEFTKAASRKHVLEEMASLLEFKRNEIKEKAEKAANAQNKEEKAFSRKSTFSALSFEVKDAPDFTVTAEELTGLNCLLQRNDAATMFLLLMKSMDILEKAERQLEEDEEERLQAFRRPRANSDTSSQPALSKQFSIFSLVSGCGQVDTGEPEATLE